MILNKKEPRLVLIGDTPVDLNTVPQTVVDQYDRATNRLSAAEMNRTVDEEELKNARRAVAEAEANIAFTCAYNNALIRDATRRAQI